MKKLSIIIAVTIIFSMLMSPAAFAQKNQVQINNQIQSIRKSIATIQTMKNNGAVSPEALKELAAHVSELWKTIKLNGGESSKDVLDVISEVDKLVGAMRSEEADLVQAAVSMTKYYIGFQPDWMYERSLSYPEPIELNPITGFSDVKPGDWYYQDVMYLAEKGAISGFVDGTFRPDNTITRAEFVKIAVAAAQGGKLTRTYEGDHWARGAFIDAYENLGLDYDSSTWDEPITRYEMAELLINLTEKILGEGRNYTAGIEKHIADYAKVKIEAKYKYFVEQAYMKGLITGIDKQGTFAGDKTGTRAQAAVMVSRMLEIKNRAAVEAVEYEPAAGEILLTDEQRPLVPKEGDIVVKTDGTKVTLKVGPSGVLGEGQEVDYYSGIRFANGHMFTTNDLGTGSMGYMGQPYYLDKYGEGHFKNDWLEIQDYYFKEAQKIKNPEEGQLFGKWLMYDGGMWHWRGPVR